jgi:hypothetical protein
MGRAKVVLEFEEGSRDNGGKVLRDETTPVGIMGGNGTLFANSVVSSYTETHFQTGHTLDVLPPMRFRELCLGFSLCRKDVVAKVRVVDRNRGWNLQKRQWLLFIVHNRISKWA